MPTAQRKLIEDTLFYRPPYDGTCFVSNEPGTRLISSDASFLPEVKDAIFEIASQGEWRQLYGLEYVIGALLILGTKYDAAMLVPFIRSLPEAFMKKIVANIPVFFKKMEISGKYNFEVGPAPELVEFAKELASSEDQEMKMIAQRAIKFIANDIKSGRQ